MMIDDSLRDDQATPCEVCGRPGHIVRTFTPDDPEKGTTRHVTHRSCPACVRIIELRAQRELDPDGFAERH